MKFKYNRLPLPHPHPIYGKFITRPIIPVTIEVNHQKVRYAAMIDSGSDFCLFHADIADYLGLDLNHGQKATFSGIEKTLGISASFFSVILSVNNHRFETVVAFSNQISDDGFGILGQKGFFDEFVVKFNFKKEDLELTAP